ncbi:MAG: ABC transporter permease [Candidatus Acidiferrales bacterium]
MGALWQDVRYSFRMFGKNPGFTLLVVLTLALGIGANSTIFSWVNSTLLNPIPGAAHTSEIVSITTGTVANPLPFSYPDLKDLQERNKSLSGLIGYSDYQMSLTGNGKPERIWGTLASANYFDVLGVRPVLGRMFLPSEGEKPGGAPVVVISYRLWQTHLGGRSSIIGQQIEINRHPYTIIGIAPSVFQGTQTGLRADLWIPVMMANQIVSGAGNVLNDRGDTWLLVMGRLKRGVSRQQAEADLTVVMKQIANQFPDNHRGADSIMADPLWRAPFGANYYLHAILLILMMIAGVVLLLACANVANLLLVRSVARRREIAIRLSMGATRWRLIRQLLVESLVLSLAGGGIAVLLTIWTSGTFSRFIPPTNVPISMNSDVDRTVLLATFVIAIITGIIFGILPALRSSGIAPVEILKEEGAGVAGGVRKGRLSGALAVAQIALSLILLICAGLFIRSFQLAQQFDPGFNPHHVLLASYNLFSDGYTKADGTEFDRQLLAKLEALPGIRSVSLSSWVPLGFNYSSEEIKPEGYVPQRNESMQADDAIIAPNYFRTMEIPLVSGRDFTPQDTEKSQAVAIVNQALASRYWPNQDPLGKKIHARDRWFTVIGVARNSDYMDLKEKPQTFVYFPLFQVYHGAMTIHARVAGDPLGLASVVENAVHGLSADLPVDDVSTLQTRVLLNTTNNRLAGTFVGIFGFLALILAAVGIYGVIAYSTRQRTHEIGIRMVLGAAPRDVFRIVIGQGARLIVTGLAIGLVASFLLTRLLSAQLFGISAADPATYIGVAMLLAVVALLACYIPAWRAMRVDPMVALRYE